MLCARFLLPSILLIILFVQTGHADIDTSRNQLKEIEFRIENAQIDLKKNQQSEVQFSRELAMLKRTLKQIDTIISSLVKEQRKLESDVKAQRQLVAEKKNSIRHIGRRLEKRLVALYKEGEIGPLKILFSADSPTELVQQYHYLTRIVEFDRDLLEEFRLAVKSQNLELAELERLTKQKSLLLDKEKQQRRIADDGRRLQSRLLAQVKREKGQLEIELSGLKEKAKRLQGLITRLQQDKVTPTVVPSGSLSFDSGKGTLGWPVKGQVLIDFGTQKDKSLGTYYESNGIEISVVAGTSIQAVANGKVVFADWFNGYGNLMILSHPGGFHTLYAQADRLEKSLGEQVVAGDILGKSGLGGRDSIYFEIRQNGSPVNPLTWLQRR